MNLDVPTSFRNGVSIQPSNVTAYQDEIVTFVCNVDHEGEIIIEWFKNGHKLKNKDRVSTINILKMANILDWINCNSCKYRSEPTAFNALVCIKRFT